MIRPILRIALVAILAPLFSQLSPAKPVVIDDVRILKTFDKAMGWSVGAEGIPSADELSASMKESKFKKPGIPLPEPPELPGNTSYNDLSRSVFLVGSVYKCGKCDKWHQGGTASAWPLYADGVMVTNAHVFMNVKGGAMGVVDREGKCYPVTEILGYDVAKDVAVFRVKAEGLRPLRIGEAAEVGSPVTVISNPSGNLFLRTSGDVARYSIGAGKVKKSMVTWMSITADYAKGSSGGPVFNEVGEVVGMVSSTRSIYTEQDSDPKKPAAGKLQMVIKSCVPGDAIRELFSAADPEWEIVSRPGGDALAVEAAGFLGEIKTYLIGVRTLIATFL
jgi:serine protease Do